jgi:TolB-like protein/DNA-binding winged helix-turn-helix (wHTH) protein/Tfp pilus assembly protein PilF
MTDRSYLFGEFRLDGAGKVLYRGEERVPLTPKAMDTLLLLVERHGDVVDKDELLRRVWPDTFVEEISLTRNISVLRKVLANGVNGRDFIETVPKRGYRFVTGVQTREAAKNGTAGDTAQRTSEVSSRRYRWTVSVLAFGLAVLLATGIYLGLRRLGKRTGLLQERIMLAVLPVQNLTGDAEREYISDGLTEEMIAQLGNLNPQRLGVIARTSSMAYKQSLKTVDQIARELGVEYILEASIRGTENHLRVTAQLIRARDQTHLWAHDYDRDIGDVVGLQDEIGLAVAQQIHLQLTPVAGERLAKSHRVAPEAYQSYLRGRYYWNTRSKDGLWKSVDYFQQAIEKDSTNARAYAGLADAYNMLMFYGYFRGAAGVLYAKAAADKALERDDSLAEAHAALAYVNFMWTWDWPAAEREFQRATELDQNYSLAHHWYALYLAAMGRRQESIEEIKMAQKLDPQSANVNTAAAYLRYFARQYDQAISESQTVLNANPDFMVAHAVLGLAYEGKGATDKAIAEFQRAIEISGDRTSVYLGWLGHAYAVSGRRPEAEKILEELDDAAKQGFMGLSHKAVIYAGLGEREKAIACLRGAREQQDAALIWLKVDPHYAALRDDPNFQELLKEKEITP